MSRRSRPRFVPFRPLRRQIRMPVWADVGLRLAAAFGVLGFIDDYAKVTKQTSAGLTSKQKLLAQTVVGFKDIERMPPRLASLAVAVATFTAGCFALALADPRIAPQSGGALRSVRPAPIRPKPARHGRP